MVVAPEQRAPGGSLSFELSQLVGPARGGRVAGVEHEYAVWRHGAQVEFSKLIHSLKIDGRALHPLNGDVYLTPAGIALMADGWVAEVASPPIDLEPGFTSALEGSAVLGRSLLEASLLDGMTMSGGSTHISIEVDPRLNDRITLLYARTFAVAMMLLMDRETSPGLLVRPRPGRTELCGEYLTGGPLRVAAAFAAVSVRALEAHFRKGALAPPPVRASLERGRRRYGWYVSRFAFGGDLYDTGRATPLILEDGSVITAGEYVYEAWLLARPHAEGLLSSDEIVAVDEVVEGRTVLPMEGASQEDSTDEVSVCHPVGDVLAERERPDFTLICETATWDWAAFRATSDQGSGVVIIPRRSLPSFFTRLDQGDLDDIISAYLAVSDGRRILCRSYQTERVGLYDEIRRGPPLLPRDRYGVGRGPVRVDLSATSSSPNQARGSTTRQRQGSSTALSEPQPDDSFRKGNEEGPPPIAIGGHGGGINRIWLLLGAAGVVAAALGVALLGGGEAPPVADVSSTPVIQATTTTIVEGCRAIEWSERIEFSSPDLGERLPDMYDYGPYGNEANFGAPGFVWSGVPEGVDGLGIVLVRLESEPADRDADPWADGPPVEQTVWIVSGIDPTATSLPASDWDNPLPEGVIEHIHEGGVMELPNGELSQRKLNSSVARYDSTKKGPYLFTLFAYCGSVADLADEPNVEYELYKRSVARGWFFLEP